MNCLIQLISTAANGCIPSPCDKTATEYWWTAITRELPEMAHAGIDAVLTMPPTKGQNLGNGYDPRFEYDLGAVNATRAGTQEELVRFAAVAKNYGMSFLLDAVMAHMNGWDKNGNIQRTAAGGQTLRFPKDLTCFVGPGVPKDRVFVPSEDFAYLFGRQLSYYGGYYEQGKRGYVGEGRKRWLRWLFDLLQAQGIRIDNAKSMDPWFFKQALDEHPFFNVGEAWSGNLNQLLWWIFDSGIAGRGSLFDFPRFFEIRNMCNNTARYDMSTLSRTGLCLSAPMNAVTMVNNHDIATSGNRIRWNILLGYALILTSEGLPCIYYPDWSEYGDGVKAKLKNLVWIRAKLAAGLTLWREEDYNTVVYERTGGPGLLVGLNNDSWGDAKEREVQTSRGPNVRWHDYTGHSPDVVSDEAGRVTIKIPRNDNGLGYCCYSMLWQDSPIVVSGGATTQIFEGAEDLDTLPASGGESVTVTRIWCAAHSIIKLERLSGPDSLTFRLLDFAGAEIKRAPVTQWYSIVVQSTEATGVKTAYRVKAEYTSSAGGF